MSSQQTLQTLLETKIVAIVRSPSSAELVQVARALFDGGIRAIEVTFTVPNAIRVLEQIAAESGTGYSAGSWHGIRWGDGPASDTGRSRVYRRA
jgi:2-dehydro-3-deoxyphosphogluconate aldolase/(4S)-4-hydroxy-2-oxoglutarate aldolase